MKILHLMLSCFYIDNANYQENIIPRINKKDGHEVKIIASTEVFLDGNNLGYTNPGFYLNEDNIPVQRLPYVRILPRIISKKIRAYNNLYTQIAEFKPDVILFHGAAALALVTASRYKKRNPNTRFYIDSHEDHNNSARNFFSKQILHKIFYKTVLQYCLPFIDKILYITYETRIFLKEIYRIPDNVLFYFPLGGIIPKMECYTSERKNIRAKLNMAEEEILIIHSGKMDNYKRTYEIVNGFCKVKNDKMKLLMMGSMEKEIENKVMPLINNDSRITFLGWLDGNNLRKYLMAGDLYIQLGGQSVTMQNALCCGCAVALFPFESHIQLLNDTAFYIREEKDIISLLQMISNDPLLLSAKREKAFNLAKNILDYNKISSVLYN